jgi:ankyrin repeat protein
MEDIEMNGEANDESSCLTDKEVFTAVKTAVLHNMKIADNSDNSSISVTDTQGRTALHNAVLTACQSGDPDGDFHRSIDLLISQHREVNRPDRYGYTAMGLAAEILDKTCIEHMLKHPSAERFYLDYYPGEREYTVRESIIYKYPDLQSVLRAPLMESLDSPERDIKLLAALQRDKYNFFIENLDTTNPNPWYNEPYHSSLLEIACQMKRRKQFVELLLDNGADPNITNRVTGMPLLHATARSGNFEVLEILLKRQHVDIGLTDNAHHTILHWWAWVSERNQGDNKSLENCFQFLLQKDFCGKVGIDYKDVSGVTPLCYAVQRENRDRVILLLGSGANVMKSERARPILESCNTSILEDILDYCLESNNEPVNSEHLMVKLRYRTLLGMLFLAEVPHHKHTLRHPAFSIFLNLTWKNTVNWFFFLNVTFYILFLAFLTAYILYSESVDIASHRSVANNTNMLVSHNDSHMTSGMKDATWHNTSQVLRYFLMILLGLLCMREVFQLYVYRWRYIKSLENWLEIMLIIVTFISCSGTVDGLQIKRHFFAVAILLGWFELVLILGRLPLLSVQLEMLKTVSSTFLKFMAGYIVLILAFAFSFYILFKGTVEVDGAVYFDSPLISLITTIFMFAGEFESSNVPFDTSPVTSHVIFLLFIFLVAIVLLNLLNGLAVNDTEEIRKVAETLSLVARARIISSTFDLLSAFPQFMTCSFELTEEMFVLYPNMPNELGPTELPTLKRIIAEKRKPSKKEKSFEHTENWSLFTEQLSTLQSQSEEMRQILMKILTYLDIQERSRVEI